MLADLLTNQVDQKIDVFCMGKASAGVDVQTGEGKVVGQADLKEGQIALQPLLLVNNQVGPSTADRLNGGSERSKPAA